MADYIITWYGKPVRELNRNELLEVLNFAFSELRELQSPKAMRARALGR